MPKLPIQRYKHNGVVLVFLAGALVVFLIALGVAVYTGITALIQGDIQYMANSAALAGARSMFDDTQPRDNTRPRFDAGLAQTAAENVAYRIKNTQRELMKHRTTLHSVTVNKAEQSVSTEVRAEIPTPFLSFIQINTLKLRATAKALYCHILLPNQLINTQKGPNRVIIPLPLPLINGYGPDIYLLSDGANGYGSHAVRVEVCTVANGGLSCYDTGKGARALISRQSGISRERLGYRYLYGHNFIDIGKVGIHKGTVLRISDDGVHDSLAGNDGDGHSMGRSLELVPSDTLIKNIRLMHYAALCDTAACKRPAGMVPAPDYDAGAL